MKHRIQLFGQSLALSILIFSGGFMAPAFATGYVNDADIQKVTDALDGLNAYTAAFQDTSVPLSTVVADGNVAQAKLQTLATYSFNNTLGDAYTQSGKALNHDAIALAADITIINADLQQNNIDKANLDVKTLNTDVDKFNTDTTALNAGVDQHNAPIEKTVKTTSSAYLALLIIAALVCIGSFVWAKRGSADATTKHAKLGVAKASILPVIGAVITYGSFQAAKNGGSYVLAWGPIGIGGIVYVRSIINYIQARSRAVPLPPAPVSTANGNAAATQPGFNTTPSQQFNPTTSSPQSPLPPQAPSQPPVVTPDPPVVPPTTPYQNPPSQPPTS